MGKERVAQEKKTESGYRLDELRANNRAPCASDLMSLNKTLFVYLCPPINPASYLHFLMKF